MDRKFMMFPLATIILDEISYIENGFGRTKFYFKNSENRLAVTIIAPYDTVLEMIKDVLEPGAMFVDYDDYKEQ